MKKRYRFVGNPKTYIWDEKPVVGEIYPEDHCGTYNGSKYAPLNAPDEFIGKTALEYCPNDWEEVDEELEEVLVDFKSELRDLLERYAATIEFNEYNIEFFVRFEEYEQEVVIADSVWLGAEDLD